MNLKALNNEIKGDKKELIIRFFQQKFLVTPFNGLMWNNFKYHATCLAFEDMEFMDIPVQNLLFYLERQKRLYETNLQVIIELINGLEPWEEIDAEIFDISMSWVVPVTHEDKLLSVVAKSV